MVAYSTTQSSQTPHMQLFVYDIQGGEHQAGYFNLVDDSMGWLGDVLVGSDGRVVLNASLKMQVSNGAPTLGLLTTLVFP
jgi:hypothetical protein